MFWCGVWSDLSQQPVVKVAYSIDYKPNACRPTDVTSLWIMNNKIEMILASIQCQTSL